VTGSVPGLPDIGEPIICSTLEMTEKTFVYYESLKREHPFGLQVTILDGFVEIKLEEIETSHTDTRWIGEILR
jgi:hypothetical protein